jgi:hypothetical protein
VVTRVNCYAARGSVYLADVETFNNNDPQLSKLLCRSTAQERAPLLASMQLTVSEVITEVRVCSDAGGVRGLALLTSEGNEYTCGAATPGPSCSTFRGRGGALDGLGGRCEAAGALQRLKGVVNPCWDFNYRLPVSPCA